MMKVVSATLAAAAMERGRPQITMEKGLRESQIDLDRSKHFPNK